MTIYLEENIRSSPEVDNITNDQTFSSPANGNGDGEVYQQEGQQTVELPVRVHYPLWQRIILCISTVGMMVLFVFGCIYDPDGESVGGIVFTGIMCFVCFPFLAFSCSWYYVGVDEQGITKRECKTQFVPWTEIGRIDISSYTGSPNSESPIRGKRTEIFVVTNVRGGMMIDHWEGVLKPVVEAIQSYKPQLVTYYPPRASSSAVLPQVV